MSFEEKVSRYTSMWTDEIAQYGLFTIDASHPVGALIFDLNTGGPMTMDDEDAVVAEVLARMRKAGVRVLSREEVERKGGPRR